MRQPIKGSGVDARAARVSNICAMVKLDSRTRGCLVVEAKRGKSIDKTIMKSKILLLNSI